MKVDPRTLRRPYEWDERTGDLPERLYAFADSDVGFKMANRCASPSASEYGRKGALQYLAAWDVHRGMVLGSCEAKTGIQPSGRLMDQVLEQEPYHDADRLFFVVDNGSSHRGQATVVRMRRPTKGLSSCTPRCMRVG